MSRSHPLDISAHHRTLWLLLACTAAAYLGGCAPAYYPNMNHAPLFSDAGEIRASGNLTDAGYEVMGAVSPTRHLGIIGSYAWGDDGVDTLPPQDHRHGEIALCYYGTLEPRIHYEFIGGYGAGAVHSYKQLIRLMEDDPAYSTAASEYRRAFIQGDFGTTNLSKEHGIRTEGAFSLRLSYVRFTRLRTGDEVMDGTAKYFFEPASVFRVGHPAAMLEMQVGFSVMAAIKEPFDHHILYASIGLHLRLGGDTP